MTDRGDNGQAVPAILPFEFEKHSVRAIEKAGGEIWFVLSDVCRVLSLSNPSTVARALDDDERSKFFLGRQGEGIVVSESGLNVIILRSHDAITPGTVAHKFRKWVTSEVLPAIRKRGHYSHPALLPAGMTPFDPLRPIRRGQPVFVEGTAPVERAWLEHDYLPEDRHCSPWIIGRPVKILGIAPGPNLADVWSDIEAKAASRNPQAPAPDWQGTPPRIR